MWQPLITKHSTQRGQIQSFKSRREGLGLYKTSLISYIQLILLGKESVVCTEQPHSWKELHNINQGGPVWSSCFLEKLEEAQEETLGFVYLLLMYTKKKLPDCFMLLLGVFLLCHCMVWWEKRHLLLILHIEAWGIWNCSVGKHSQFLEKGKKTIPQQLSDLQSNSLKVTLNPPLFFLRNKCISILSSKVLEKLILQWFPSALAAQPLPKLPLHRSQHLLCLDQTPASSAGWQTAWSHYPHPAHGCSCHHPGCGRIWGSQTQTGQPRK